MTSYKDALLKHMYNESPAEAQVEQCRLVSAPNNTEQIS